MLAQRVDALVSCKWCSSIALGLSWHHTDQGGRGGSFTHKIVCASQGTSGARSLAARVQTRLVNQVHNSVRVSGFEAVFGLFRDLSSKGLRGFFGTFQARGSGVAGGTTAPTTGRVMPMELATSVVGGG